MTEEQSKLVLQILARLEPYFAADDIRPCRFCGVFVRSGADVEAAIKANKVILVAHNAGCVVTMIRELKKTLPAE